MDSVEAPSVYDNRADCEDIIPKISVSKSYEQAKVEFLELVNNISKKEEVEGHSGVSEGETRMLHYLAGHKRIKTVCETGFNIGHSSLNYLTANGQLVVYSFDLGEHRYALEMSEYMTKKFPGRFFIHFGNSVMSIPEFIRDNPNFKCDFMLVDGGHWYPVALAVTKNLARIWQSRRRP